VIREVAQAIGLHVHPEDFPVGGFEDALGQVMADEAIDTQNQNFFHE
jgi:hypothetical protein